MKTCERNITLEKTCGQKASHVRLVPIINWKDGKPGTFAGERLEYLCDHHADWHRKMGHAIKKLHVLAVS